MVGFVCVGGSGVIGRCRQRGVALCRRRRGGTHVNRMSTAGDYYGLTGEEDFYVVRDLAEGDEGLAEDVRVVVCRTADDVRDAQMIWENSGRPWDNDSVQDASATLMVLRRNGTPVAVALLLREVMNVCIRALYVHMSMRGRGYGRRMMERILMEASPLDGVLYVDAEKGIDMGFYSILGFEKLGKQRFDERKQAWTVRMALRQPAVSPVGHGSVGLHHTSIRVSNMERSLAFYGMLGLYLTEKFHTQGGLRACYIEGLGTRLELVEFELQSTAKEEVVAISRRHPLIGFDRLVFDVTKACPDLESFLEYLQSRSGGALTVSGPPSQLVQGCTVLSVTTVTDPDGVPVEFIRRDGVIPRSLTSKPEW